jgi:hypothetical protein
MRNVSDRFILVGLSACRKKNIISEKARLASIWERRYRLDIRQRGEDGWPTVALA